MKTMNIHQTTGCGQVEMCFLETSGLIDGKKKYVAMTFSITEVWLLWGKPKDGACFL